jgi:hypothetical protein
MRIHDLVQRRLLFNAFLLKKLPLAWIAGIKRVRFSENSCSCQLKSCWISNNPWKSMYFAAEAMAAELCSGLLVLKFLEEASVPASTLIISMSAEFHKKAVGVIDFKAALSPDQISQLTQLKPEESTSFQVTSVATNSVNEVVATFNFEWSVKRKN